MKKDIFEKMMNIILKNREMVLFLSACGILLILLSNMFTSKTQISKEVKSEDNVMSYEERIEKKLNALLKKIDPTGNVTAMVTFEDGYEYMVATETKKSTHNQKNQDGESINEEQIENKVVLVEQVNGTTPFIIQKKYPKVRGVAIVSEGARDKNVYIGLIKVATSVLGITPDKVEVVIK